MNQDTPITTNSNQTPYDGLCEKDKMAVDMAARGISYSDIAKQLHRSRDTVKDWFSSRGRLCEALKSVKEGKRYEYQQKFKEIDKLIQEGAVVAIESLIEMAKLKNMVGMMAARDLLDRAGFKSREKTLLEENASSGRVVIELPDNGRRLRKI